MARIAAVTVSEHPAAGPGRDVRLVGIALRLLTKAHVSVYRRTGGKIGGRAFGNRVLLLTTTGRRTGQPRTTPVTYLADGDALFIVGGGGGSTSPPAWWLNHGANPRALVQVGRRIVGMRATEATPQEQRQLWSRHAARRALFNSMQRRAPRPIPVVALRPIAGRHPSAPAGPPVPTGERAEGHAPRGAGAARRGRRYPIFVAARLLNPLMRKLAGRQHLPQFALVSHRGRHSGHLYATPVGARRTADGFVIPLTFGEGADWFRNVSAAGRCVIRWNGADYTVAEPVVTDWAAARPAFHAAERVLIRLLGIERFVRLRFAPAAGHSPPSATA